VLRFAPIWNQELKHGQPSNGRKWREEYSDIKLEFTFIITRQEPDDAKVSRPDLSTGPEVTKGLV
jgi:hypothetical protein